MNDSLYESLNVYAASLLVQPQRGEIPVRLVNPSIEVVALEPKTISFQFNLFMHGRVFSERS